MCSFERVGGTLLHDKYNKGHFPQCSLFTEIEPRSPTLQADSLPSEPAEKPGYVCKKCQRDKLVFKELCIFVYQPLALL